MTGLEDLAEVGHASRGYFWAVAAATTVMLALSLGCGSSPAAAAAADAVVPLTAFPRGTAAVVASSTGRTLAVGAVVRVTWDWVVLLATAVPAGEEVLVRWPGELDAVPAPVLGRFPEGAVLAAPRRGRDVRPLELATDVPPPLSPVSFLGQAALAGPFRGTRPVVLSDEPPTGRARGVIQEWLAAGPALDEDDDRSNDARARAAEGGLVFDASGRLLALATAPEEGKPRVLLAAPLVRAVWSAILRPPGADLVRADDGFLAYRATVESLVDLPRCDDEDGAGPLLALEVRTGGDLVARIEVTPGRPIEPVVFVARTPAGASVTLVALDRSLARGETRVELAKPVALPGLAPRIPLSLEVRPEAAQAYPSIATGPRLARGALLLAPVDPDAGSGARRTPSGASSIVLGRAVEGQLDLPGGASTDFLSVTAPRAEPVLAILLRRRSSARVELHAFAPGFESDLLALALPQDGARLAAVRGKLPRGRTLLRVRQTGGAVATGYELLVVPATDAPSIVRPFFRLLGREATREETAFLDSDAFIREAGEALDRSGLPHEAISRALIDELGEPQSRVVSLRRLALYLLERSFVPPVTLLREAVAAGGPSADDAGLVLAELEPRNKDLRPLLRRACRDGDPTVRARAVRCAARSGDAAFASELATLLANDPAPVVERAVATARAAASRLQKGQD